MRCRKTPPENKMVHECGHERCFMIEMIGLATLCMLLWVLASSMAAESDAEQRRVAISEA